MTTPDYLKKLLERNPREPMVHSRHLIIVRDLAAATVEQVLTHLDQRGELMELSVHCEPSGPELPE